MRRFARRIPFVLALVAIAVAVYFIRTHRDRFAAIAPGVFLSWDGVRWAVPDNRHEPNVGIDKPLPGGIVIVDRVRALAKQGDHLVGQAQDGAYFIVDLRPLRRDEMGTDTVTTFASEQEWRARARLKPPLLVSPGTPSVADTPSPRSGNVFLGRS